MADEPENLILRFLRRLQEQNERIYDEIRDLKQRMTALETAEASHYTATMSRFDRMEVRLDRIERRLDLTEASA
jgi:hypothetical protein